MFVDAKVIPAKDYESKIMTLLAGGTEMDAYMNKRSTDIFPMVDNGYAEPLDELIAAHQFDMTSLAGYKGAITIDGETYALPFRGEAYFTYYNKKVFEQAGAPTPDTYVEKGEWTVILEGGMRISGVYMTEWRKTGDDWLIINDISDTY